MNIGDKFIRFVATEDAKATGAGKKLAERMINPEKYRKKLLKSAVRKLTKKKKKKVKDWRTRLREAGKKKMKFPKLPAGYRKRMSVRIKPAQGNIFLRPL